MSEPIITIQDGTTVWKLWLEPSNEKFPICLEEFNGRIEKGTRYLSIQGALDLVDGLMRKIAESRSE